MIPHSSSSVRSHPHPNLLSVNSPSTSTRVANRSAAARDNYVPPAQYSTLAQHRDDNPSSHLEQQGSSHPPNRVWTHSQPTESITPRTPSAHGSLHGSRPIALNARDQISLAEQSLHPAVCAESSHNSVHCRPSQNNSAADLSREFQGAVMDGMNRPGSSMDQSHPRSHQQQNFNWNSGIHVASDEGHADVRSPGLVSARRTYKPIACQLIQDINVACPATAASGYRSQSKCAASGSQLYKQARTSNSGSSVPDPESHDLSFRSRVPPASAALGESGRSVATRIGTLYPPFSN